MVRRAVASAEKSGKRKLPRLVSHRLLAPLEFWLTYLHDLPAHGNRDVLADHLLVAHLVAFLSPALTSLRRIESVFDHPLARQRFGLPRMPKSTFSDAQALFDAALLQPIIADLRARVPALPHDPRLDELLKNLTAVDGTFFAMAPRVWWAIYNKPRGRKTPGKGQVRVDVHFNVLAGVPEQFVLTNGQTPEYQTLREHLRPQRFYVVDRAFHAYELFAAILAVGSDFLVRLRGDMQFELLEERALTPAQQAAGLQQWQIVRPQGWRGTQQLGQTSLALLTIRQADGELLRLLTNRLDLDADVLSMAYRRRWQIELFFRWLKCLVNFRHFFSEGPEGVALQVGAAVIGTLLLALAVQDRPNSYDWAMMTHVISGLLPLDQKTLEIMAARRAERNRAAQWQKEYRARKKIER